jgi:hypothetical protein
MMTRNDVRLFEANEIKPHFSNFAWLPEVPCDQYATACGRALYFLWVDPWEHNYAVPTAPYVSRNARTRRALHGRPARKGENHMFRYLRNAIGLSLGSMQDPGSR